MYHGWPKLSIWKILHKKTRPLSWSGFLVVVLMKTALLNCGPLI